MNEKLMDKVLEPKKCKDSDSPPFKKKLKIVGSSFWGALCLSVDYPQQLCFCGDLS